MTIAQITGQTVDFNPWLACALELTFRFVFSGAVWMWFFLPEKPRTRAEGAALACALSLLIGLLFSSLTTVLLGELGIYKRELELLAAAAFSCAGLFLGLQYRAKRLFSGLKAALPAAVLFFGGAATIMLAPAQGEWVKGGWDPGVYMNAGVSLARTGTFYPPDRFFNRLIPQDGQELFLRFAGKRVERFPGVMQNKGIQSLHFHFFRLTPALVANVCRAGGIRAAMRVNAFIGLAALLCVFSCLLLLSGPLCAAAAAALLCMQPVFLYHTHTPVSEMAELCLLFAALPLVMQKGLRYRALLAAAVMGLVVNKLSFLPFGAMLVIFSAWADRDRPDRVGALGEQAFVSAGLAAGMLADLVTSPASAWGWTILPVLFEVSALFLLAATLFHSAAVRARIAKISERIPPSAFAGTALLLAAMFVLPRLAPGGEDSANLIRFVRYAGWPVFLLALAGGACMAFGRKAGGGGAADIRKGLGAAVLFLLGVTVIVLVRKNIVDVYPWATRRYLSCGMPLLAVCAAYALVFAKDRLASLSRPMASVFVPAALLMIFSATLPMQAGALLKTEADGLCAALSEVAGEIDDEDIVVADHFSSGTPLACLFGKRVLNGERLLRRQGPDKAARAFKLLEGLARQGNTVRFLTSTDEALSVYPVPVPGAEEDKVFPAVTLKTIKHHKNLAGFETEDERAVFRLYTLDADKTRD